MKYNINAIEEYMEKNNLTKTQFCKKCGISHNTLNNIYKNVGRMRIESIYKILIVLEISFDNFLGKQ